MERGVEAYLRGVDVLLVLLTLVHLEGDSHGETVGANDLAGSPRNGGPGLGIRLLLDHDADAAADELPRLHVHGEGGGLGGDKAGD